MLRRISAVTFAVAFAAGAKPAAGQEAPPAEPVAEPAPVEPVQPPPPASPPATSSDDSWSSLIQHGQRASGEESLQELEASTVARERVYSSRRGLRLAFGAEGFGAAGHSLLNDESYGELLTAFGAAAVGSVRYGFGLVAIEVTARLGAAGYDAELERFDYELGSTQFTSEEGTAPLAGIRGGARVYLGTLPAYVGAHLSGDLLLMGDDLGVQPALGLGGSLGGVFGPDETFDVAFRASVCDFTANWDGKGFELVLGLTYVMPR